MTIELEEPVSNHIRFRISEITRLLERRRLCLQENINNKKLNTKIIQETISILLEAIKHSMIIHDLIFIHHILNNNKCGQEDKQEDKIDE
jgi:hypothetical protein